MYKSTRNVNKIGFAIQLCCLRYPGWTFADVKSIPHKMLTYISKQLNLSYTDFNHYGERRATRFTHIEEICTWYGYKPFTDTESRALEEYIEEKAIASDEPFSLVKSGIDFLRNKKIILPGITTIERIVRKVCINIESSLFSDIYSCLVPEQYRLLDKVIESQDEKVITVLGMLRNVSGQCSPQAFNDVADKLKQVRELNLNVDLSFIHPNRIKQIYRAVSRYEPHMFRRFPNQKKYALLVIYLQMLEQKLVDMAVEIHDKLINTYLSKGRKLQDKMQQENGKSINEKVHLFINIGAALIRSREAVHVIDGLLEHETDLCINEHYTDTAGYTDQVFGLSHLLGFVFAPRIRDISDSKLYLLPGMELKKNINNLASARINTNIIEQNYEDILRLAYSIKDGLVSSSLILSKLGSYSRQNSLAKALQEMGRIEKTIFILRYATDNVLRRRILVGLNKGEAMNGLARAVFFGKQGELRERDLQDQLQRASALNILINAISIWNTVYLEKAIEYKRNIKV